MVIFHGYVSHNQRVSLCGSMGHRFCNKNGKSKVQIWGTLPPYLLRFFLGLVKLLVCLRLVFLAGTWEMVPYKTSTHSRYPLVNVYIAMENHHFSWENPLWITIFNSYVKLPEGISTDPILHIGGEFEKFIWDWCYPKWHKCHWDSVGINLLKRLRPFWDTNSKRLVRSAEPTSNTFSPLISP